VGGIHIFYFQYLFQCFVADIDCCPRIVHESFIHVCSCSAAHINKKGGRGRKNIMNDLYCIYIYIYIHVYTYIYIYTYIADIDYCPRTMHDLIIYVWPRTATHTSRGGRGEEHTQTHVCVCKIYVCIHMYVYTHTCVYIYILLTSTTARALYMTHSYYICTHVCVPPPSPHIHVYTHICVYIYILQTSTTARALYMTHSYMFGHELLHKEVGEGTGLSIYI